MLWDDGIMFGGNDENWGSRGDLGLDSHHECEKKGFL